MVVPNPSCVCGVSVPCCEGIPLPETLNVSLTASPPESCTCLNGAGAACQWDGTRWVGYTEVCGDQIEIEIVCIAEFGWFGGSVRCGGGQDGQSGWGPDSCKPFAATFQLETEEFPNCCESPLGSIIAVVTG